MAIQTESHWTSEFVVPGKPRAAKRPRVGRNGHVYAPDKADQLDIRAEYRAQFDWDMVVGQPVTVAVEAFFPYPKSLIPRSRKEFVPMITKPDVDNICKLYVDALVGVVIKDDNLVDEVSVKKYYTHEEPHVKVTVEW